ncbi:MAG: DUF1127 domain-containing protein [Rhodobacteraceae bacterium]|nr:DUF1127 domain-containing protein [Paracoccaceae bacterium]
MSNPDIGPMGVVDRIRAMIERFKHNSDQRRVYRQTHAELSALSTAHLEELGISRCMISRIAHDAAYGKQN